jgi:hypothetical protein
LDLLENTFSEMSSLLEPGEMCWGQVVKKTPVLVTTLDQYCQEKGIHFINLLKIDTQGYDLEVLKGAKGLLQSNRIQLIFMEVNFANIYKGQAAFEDVLRYLADANIRLVSLYRFYHKNNVAAWSDALFVNPAFNAGRIPESVTTRCYLVR